MDFRDELRALKETSALRLIECCPSFYMREIAEIIPMVANARSILITGDTGTGKELVAKALHEASNRKDRVLRILNCGNVNEHLVASELFGHEKGAFTGAYSKKTGILELVNGSTLFLDEIEGMPLEFQSRLLRVLDEFKFQRVGGTDDVESVFNVVAATNVDLKLLISKGLFRRDLYHRLNGFQINLMPLKDRKEDILHLSKHFLSVHKRSDLVIGPQALEILLSYEWPGNVRELRNVIERALLMMNGHTELNPEHLLFLETGKSDTKEKADGESPISQEALAATYPATCSHLTSVKEEMADIPVVPFLEEWKPAAGDDRITSAAKLSAFAYGADPEKIRGNSTDRFCSRARTVWLYILREVLQYTYAEIGSKVGIQEGTVRRNVDRFDRLLEGDLLTNRDVMRIIVHFKKKIKVN